MIVIVQTVIWMSAFQYEAHLLLHEFSAYLLVTFAQNWKSFGVRKKALYIKLDAIDLLRHPSLQEVIKVWQIGTELEDGLDASVVRAELLKSDIFVVSFLSLIEVIRDGQPKDESDCIVDILHVLVDDSGEVLNA